MSDRPALTKLFCGVLLLAVIGIPTVHVEAWAQRPERVRDSSVHRRTNPSLAEEARLFLALEEAPDLLPAMELICRSEGPYATTRIRLTPTTVTLGGQSLQVLVTKIGYWKGFHLGMTPAGPAGGRLKDGECSWADVPLQTYGGQYDSFDQGLLVDPTLDDGEIDLTLHIDLNPVPSPQIPVASMGRLTGYPDRGAVFRLQVHQVNGDPTRMIVAEGARPVVIQERATRDPVRVRP
jgi:hypothetical protein